MWGRLSYLLPHQSCSSLHSCAVCLKDCPELGHRLSAVKELHFRELRWEKEQKRQLEWLCSLVFSSHLGCHSVMLMFRGRTPLSPAKSPRQALVCAVQKTQLSWCGNPDTLSVSHLGQISSLSLTPSQFLLLNSFIFSTPALISFLFSFVLSPSRHEDSAKPTNSSLLAASLLLPLLLLGVFLVTC